MSSISEIEIERRHRIQVALWAYAYELEDDPLVDDATFDRVMRLIRPEIETGHKVLDAFFKKHFPTTSGSWVHRHPELKKLKVQYDYLRNLKDEHETGPLQYLELHET